MIVSEIITAVQEEVDPRKRRWSDPTVLALINEGVDVLAGQQCFLRREVVVPTAGVGHYALSLPAVRIERVWYNRKRLAPATYAEADAALGWGWQGGNGTPEWYDPDEGGVTLAPFPASSGTALTFSGNPTLASAAGKQMLGNRYWAASDSGTWKHFHPGDGVCDAHTAANNLWVEYYYQPEPLTLAADIPRSYRMALEHYALYRMLRTSRDPGDTTRRTDAFAIWGAEAGKIAIRNAEGLQSAEARPRLSTRKAF